MTFTRRQTVPAIAGTIALCFSAWTSGTSATDLSLSKQRASYAPVQSINYQIGSKSMSGYFVEEAGACRVTIMVSEKSDLDDPSDLTAARVRLVLYPGQVAGLDSEEGRSLNFTCAAEATTLLVDIGERDTLVKRQELALRKAVAESLEHTSGAVTAGSD